MVNKAFVLQDLEEKYEMEPASKKFERLYTKDDIGHMCAVLHERLNDHFNSINERQKTSNYYWADPSRDFIALIGDIRQDLHKLKLAGKELRLVDSYEHAIERCKPWLSPSGGSTIPDDFAELPIIEYEQIFATPTDVNRSHVALEEPPARAALKMIGQGSYADVYSYVDPNYGTKFAIKRAKRDVSERDLERFKKEFEIMKGLNFPYVLQVYKYDASRNEYSMEYCEESLRSFIDKNNNALNMTTRKRIALQFLYGINYLHLQGILHRDISFQNVLVKTYDYQSVLIKLSDFGLAKQYSSDFTRTHTQVRGTIVDPLLDGFRDYDVSNEIYPVGFVLSFIFTGRESLQTDMEGLGSIIRKCTSPTREERYNSVLEIIGELEKLPF